jgi:lipopolysaccharide/colanic/teichoic acid biosynthesis glycosyltransferase
MTTGQSTRVNNATFRHVALARRPDQLFKRALEITAAAVMLLCLAPILLMTSAAISLDSGGPVFIRETRRDYKNRAIQVFKFRITAYAGGDCHTRRLTQIGLILSQTRIDELPQLVNVLTGEISLIETVKSLLLT